MSRKTRFVIPGVPQHVIQRGHNREPCFYSVNTVFRPRWIEVVDMVYR